jgi:hypothetical protein
MKNGRIITLYLLSLKEIIKKSLCQKSKKTTKKQLRFFGPELKAEFVNDRRAKKRKNGLFSQVAWKVTGPSVTCNNSDIPTQ